MNPCPFCSQPISALDAPHPYCSPECAHYDALALPQCSYERATRLLILQIPD